MIVPIYKTPEDLATISEAVAPIVEELKAAGISVKYDDSDNQRSGWKFAEYELRGVPVRLGLGMRDLEERHHRSRPPRHFNKRIGCSRNRRRNGPDRPRTDAAKHLSKGAAISREKTHFKAVDTWEDFKIQIEKGGFILAHWDGTAETEEKIKNEEDKAQRSAAFPLDAEEEAGKCVVIRASRRICGLFLRERFNDSARNTDPYFGLVELLA